MGAKDVKRGYKHDYTYSANFFTRQHSGYLQPGRERFLAGENTTYPVILQNYDYHFNGCIRDLIKFFGKHLEADVKTSIQAYGIDPKGKWVQTPTSNGTPTVKFVIAKDFAKPAYRTIIDSLMLGLIMDGGLASMTHSMGSSLGYIFGNKYAAICGLELVNVAREGAASTKAPTLFARKITSTSALPKAPPTRSKFAKMLPSKKLDIRLTNHYSTSDEMHRLVHDTGSATIDSEAYLIALVIYLSRTGKMPDRAFTADEVAAVRQLFRPDISETDSATESLAGDLSDAGLISSQSESGYRTASRQSSRLSSASSYSQMDEFDLESAEPPRSYRSITSV
jgi:hypothetical protein